MPENLNIENVDSAPTIPLTDIQRVRLGELAVSLGKALQQGYVDANVLTQLLELAKMFLPVALSLGAKL